MLFETQVSGAFKFEYGIGAYARLGIERRIVDGKPYPNLEEHCNHCWECECMKIVNLVSKYGEEKTAAILKTEREERSWWESESVVEISNRNLEKEREYQSRCQQVFRCANGVLRQSQKRDRTPYRRRSSTCN